MKTKLTIFALTVQLFCGVSALAFDHGNIGPTMAARSGGQVVSSDEVGAHFEMVPGKKNFKLYVYPMDLKPFDSANFKITATGFSVKAKKEYYELAPGRRKGIKVFLTIVNSKTQKQDILRFVF